VRRACPRCLGPLVEDLKGDTVSCPEHGRLTAWLVLDGWGEVVAAGRATIVLRNGRKPLVQPGASWLAPELPFLVIEREDLRRAA
jgi:hypothetical protein